MLLVWYPSEVKALREIWYPLGTDAMRGKVEGSDSKILSLMAEWDNRVPVPCTEPEVGEEGEFGLVWFLLQRTHGLSSTIA